MSTKSNKMKYMLVIVLILVNTLGNSCTSKQELVSEETFENIINFEDKWKLELDSTLISKPIIQDSKVYCITKDANIYIIDINNKEIIKEIVLPKKLRREYDMDMVAYKGNIILGNKKGYIVIINIEKEDILYEGKIALDFLNNFLVSDDVLYYSRDGMSVYAMDINNFSSLCQYGEILIHAGTYPIADS
ncbi:MAG: hypothetical protein FH761_16145 [Firmicutes bacterium]|nr:hypothetical protein [Bacillota bacterium]